MRAWRLVTRQYATDPLSGEGALRYGGRWNSPGVRIAYLADSLALATLEMAVHLTGARVTYVAIELDIPESLVAPVGSLKRRWQTDQPATRSAGDAWANSANSLALSVPSALVDARSGEHNLLVNPLHPRRVQVTELQRFEVVLDERL
jgi:RES domain-containing protein